MQTVGEILKKARQKRQISLEDVAIKTKISLKYLRAIELNDFDALPPATFTKGFMQNYAAIVGLNPQTVLAIFRRDFDQDKKGRIIPRSLSEHTSPRVNFYTPTTTAIIIASFLSLLIIAFFTRQIIIFNSPPPLQITQPSPQAQVVSPITITGTTSPQAILTINNRPISVDQDGVFISELDLTQGEHVVIITATSRSDRQTTIELPLSVR